MTPPTGMPPLQEPLSLMPSQRARILAITSGKGGVGKTVLSANLAAALAQRGERVLVLDADLGLANLDVVLNLHARATLHDVFGGRSPLQDAVHAAPGGFSAVLAGSGLIEYSRLTPELRLNLQDAIDTLAQQFDRILVDTGAGISDVVLYTVSLADDVLILTTPEPTSLTDAYATAKVLATVQGRRQMHLVANQVRSAGEGALLQQQLQRVLTRFVDPTLGQAVRLDLLGELPQDGAVRDAVLRRKLFVQARSQTQGPAAQAVAALAQAVQQGLPCRGAAGEPPGAFNATSADPAATNT